MTSQARSQCSTCARFRSPLDDDTPAGVTGPYCEAFPEGIPQQIFRNQVDHRAAVRGDHGLRWQFNGEDFPEWAFPPGVELHSQTEAEKARDRAAHRIVGDYPLDLDPDTPG